MMDDPIESLLDQAIAYAHKREFGFDDEPADPTFQNFVYKFPKEQLTNLKNNPNFIEMRVDAKNGQRGMYAKCDIDTGTWLAMSQPIAAYWDVENNNGDADKKKDSPVALESKQLSTTTDASEDRDTTTEGKLILRVLEKIKSCPSIWENNITNLYPRDMNTAKALPSWICSDDSLDVKNQLTGLSKLSLFPSEKNDSVCEDIALRLPLIVRYNAFTIETSSELFVYNDLKEHGLASLAGVGLYEAVLSYFNHSCKPNASKFSIGDVTILFANRDINAGNELCHSYLSHEYLCESEETRYAILANDFRLGMKYRDNDAHEKVERPAKRMKEDSTETSTDTICIPPFILSKCFDSETGNLYKPEGPGQSFRCIDEYLFPIWKARILECEGRSNKHKFDKKYGLEHALPEWEAAIEFAEETFPPLDARKCTLYVQASLCASVCAFDEWAKLALRTKGWRVGDKQKAKRYANKAVEIHNAIFGSGLQLFLKRHSDELTSYKFRGQMSLAQLLYNLEELWGFGDELWENLTASKERGKELINCL